jgi:mannose-1-phosphate guanylyltransferase
MSYTGTQLLNMLVSNLAGTYSGDELQSFIDHAGNVTLAQAAIFEHEASKVMFSFSAGDTTVDKSKYASNLLNAAKQIRENYMQTGGIEVSTTETFSGSASFGSSEVVEFIDDDFNEPTWT